MRSKRLELLENIIEFLSEFAQRKCGIYREFWGAQFRVDGLFNHSFKGFFEEWILLGEERESGSVFMSAKLFQILAALLQSLIDIKPLYRAR